jgi:tetratricopeptide (TPR) repeat protein
MTQRLVHATLPGLICLAVLLSGCGASKRLINPILPGSRLTDQAESTYQFLKYLELLRNNEQQAALEALEQATALNPSPDLYAEQGIFHSRFRDNPELGIAAVERGLERFPMSRKLVLTYVDLQMRLERVDSAVTRLESYLEAKPDDVRASSRLAELYLQKKEYSRVVDLFKLIAEKEWTAEVHYLLAQAFAGLEDRDKAVSHLQTATRQAPDMLKAWAELAYQYEMAKEFVDAQETYAKLLDMGLNNPNIRLRLIELHLKLNNPGQALQQAQALPADENLLVKAGSLFIQNNFYAEAEEILDSLNGTAMSDKTIYLRALIAFQGQDDSEKALDLLDRIDRDSSLHSDSLSLQSQLLFKLGRNDQALQKAQTGQSLYPEQADFWILESDILRSQKRYPEAIDVLQEAREHLPEDTDILFQLGFLKHELGRPEEALDFMEKVIRINPDHAQALNFVGYTLTEQGRDLDRALILIKKALEIEPENGYFLDSLAWLYFKTQKLDKAWEAISRAVTIQGQDPVIWDHYGDIASSLGKKEKAREAYQRALELEAPNPKQIERKLEGLSSAELRQPHRPFGRRPWLAGPTLAERWFTSLDAVPADPLSPLATQAALRLTG